MLLDQLLPEGSVPCRVLEPDSATTILLQILCDQLPDHRLVIERIMLLFGSDLKGIAIRVDGAPACISLARRIIADRAARAGIVVPDDLFQTLAQLEAIIPSLAGKFPALSQLSETNPLLKFYLKTHATALGCHLSARWHIYLAKCWRRLAKRPAAKIQSSLAPRITPLKHLADKYQLDAWPGVVVLDTDKAAAEAFIEQVRTHFEKITTGRGGLLGTTIADYAGVVAEALDSPQLPKQRTYQKSAGSRTNRKTREHDEAWLADQEDADDDPTDPYNQQACIEQTLSDDLSSDWDTLTAAEDAVLENLPEITDLNQAARKARVAHLRSAAVLSQRVTTSDRATVPLQVLALGYVALIGRGAVSLEELSYYELVPLVLYHLLLMTGRNIDDLLETRIGTKPSTASKDAFPYPLYDPEQNVLMAIPKVYPGLMKRLRDIPDRASQPENYRAWQEDMRKHYRVYQRVELMRQIVLDEGAGYLLRRLYSLRPAVSETDHLFLVENTQGEVVPFDHAAALKLITRPITDLLRRFRPEYPRLTFSQLRHTFWTRFTGEGGNGGGVHPILAQMQADVSRMELRARLFYHCVSLGTLQRGIVLAQRQLLEQVQAAYIAVLPKLRRTRLLPDHSDDTFYPLKLDIPPTSVIVQASEEYYGACYYPRPAVVAAVVRQLLLEVSRAPSRYADQAQAEKALHNARVVLCAFLAAVSSATRMIEITGLRSGALDLDYDPPLITLAGKTSRFTEEIRTLPIPLRLVSLWRLVLPVNPGSSQALHIYTGKNQTLKPLSRADLWQHLRRAASLASLDCHLNLGDEVFKFHSFRHLLASYLLEQGMPSLRAAYLLGHQSAGSEHSHSFGGLDFRETWRLAEQHLGGLLDVLGVTEAAMQAVIARPEQLELMLATGFESKVNQAANSLAADEAGYVEVLSSAVATPAPGAELAELVRPLSVGLNISKEETDFLLNNPGSPDMMVLSGWETGSVEWSDQIAPETTRGVALPQTLIDSLSALGKNGPPSLTRVCRAVLTALAREKLLSVSEEGNGKLDGLSSTFLQRVFERLCRSDRQHELSPRQRSQYVRHFNRVRETVQPYFATALDAVKNYSRAARSTPVLAKTNLVVPPSTYKKLLKVLEEEVLQNTRVDRDTWFDRWLLLMVLRLGVSFEGCVAGLCRVRAQDLGPGCVVIPRDRQRIRWLRVWLDDLTMICLSALLIHTCRNPDQVNRREVQPIDRAMMLSTGKKTAPTEREIKKRRARLNTYLTDLCHRAGVRPLTVEDTLPLTRWVLNEQGVYSGPVISVLSGATNTSVMPLHLVNRPMSELDQHWQVPDKLPNWDGLRSSTLALAEIVTVAGWSTEDDPDEDTRSSVKAGGDSYSSRLTELHTVMRDLDDTPATKKAVKAGLEKLACEWLGVEKAEQLPAGLKAALQPGSRISPTTFNLVCLVAWLTSLLTGKKRVKTAITYRSDAEAILRLYPQTHVCYLGQGEAEVFLELDAIEGPRLRRRSAWQSWYYFLKHIYHLPMETINLKTIRWPRKTIEEELLTPGDLVRLMEHLAATGSGGSERQNQLSHLVYIAAPFAYFGMLRIGELIRLRLCDIVLDSSEPHLLIFNSKRGKSRKVYLKDVPSPVLEFFRQVYQQRLNAVKSILPINRTKGKKAPSQLTALLLTDLQGQELSEPVLSRAFSRALHAIGYKDSTTHTLRKSGASWRYWQGVDVRDISRGLGHATVEVTFLSYLRVSDLEQRRSAEKMQCPQVILAPSKLAGMLDVTTRMGQKLAQGRTLDIATVRKLLTGQASQALGHVKKASSQATNNNSLSTISQEVILL
jgi:integrase